MLKNKLAIFIPSSKRMIDIIMELADVKKGDVLYDLGSGDGRVLLEAAKRGIKVVGIEQNPFLNWIARRKLKNFNSVKIIQGNIFNQDLSKATILVAYLSQTVARKLQKKIEKEVKKGSRIILVDHHFSNWVPVRMKRVGILPIRLYVK